MLNIIKKEVSDLYKLYENDENMLQKLNSSIFGLRDSLQNYKHDLVKREERKKTLQDDSEVFVKKFFNNHNYYYCAVTEIFFKYDNFNYNLNKEDDILHHILSSVSNDRTIMPWKYKIKNNVIKQIKENDIFQSIPESETIQSIISYLTLNIFEEREYSKYFLTYMGDILFKKDCKLCFVPLKMKKIITDIQDHCYIYFGVYPLQNYFKYKFHEHDFNDCRILKCRSFLNYDTSQLSFLNLLCVSAYYSNRYESSEKFLLEHCKDQTIVNHICYLPNHNKESILYEFKESMFDIIQGENNVMKWDEILYLWKQFIEDLQIPNVCFSQHLKEEMKILFKANYDESIDKYIGLTSKHLPYIDQFNKFWEEQIEYQEEQDLEIDEFYTLFKKHNGSMHQLNEKKLLDLIKHYYPEVNIEDDKYITDTNCKLWNKKEDIKKFMDFMFANHPNEEHNIQHLYNLYLKYYKGKMVVSKRYFEKYITTEYQHWMSDNCNISLPSIE